MIIHNTKSMLQLRTFNNINIKVKAYKTNFRKHTYTPNENSLRPIRH